MSAQSQPEVGSELAGYRIVKVLGQSRIGCLYLADDVRRGRRVLLRLIEHAHPSNRTAHKQLLQATQLAATIGHPNILPVEAGEASGVLFLAAPDLAAVSLRDVLAQEGPLEPRRALAIVAQVADAVDTARWARGLCHGAIRAEQVLLTSGDDGEHVYLTGFGWGALEGSRVGTRGPATKSRATRSDAPEQHVATDGTPLTDVYAVGDLLAQCVGSGSRSLSDHERAGREASSTTRSPEPRESRPSVPAELTAVIGKAMASAPEGRYSTCGDFVNAAQRALAGDTTPKLELLVPREITADRVEALEVPGDTEPSAADIGARDDAPLPDRAGVWKWLGIDDFVVRHRGPLLVLVAVGLLLAIAAVGIVPTTGVREAGLAVGQEDASEPSDAVGAELGSVDVREDVGRPFGGPLIDSDSVVRVDLSTNEPVAAIEVGAEPTAVALSSGAVWVASRADGSVTKVDPETETVLGTVDVEGVPTSLVRDEGSVWVALVGSRVGGGVVQAAVTRIVLDNVVGTVEVGVPAPAWPQAFAGLAVDLSTVWLTTPQAPDGMSALLRISPSDGSVTEVAKAPTPFSEVALGAGSAWVGNFNGTVVRVDRDTNAIMSTIDVGGRILGVAFGEGAVWISSCDEVGGFVSRINPNTNRVSRRHRVRGCSHAVTLGAGSLWVGMAEQNVILRMDPANGGVLSLIDLGARPEEIAVGANSVWVAATPA